MGLVLFNEIKQFLNSEQISYTENAIMKNYTSFRIGGLCRVIAYPETFEQVSRLIKFCKASKIKFFFLGNGSNLLFCDSGYDGIAISSEKFNKIELVSGKTNEIYCESGVALIDLCRFALFCSLSGLEFAYGIPGSLGGAIFMNAGAYGGEMKDVVFSVACVDCSGNFRVLSGDELKFGYRFSVFVENGGFVLWAKIRCKKFNKNEIKNKMDDLMKRRILKQPLNFPSAGSAFKRPEGGFASQLIESCGLKKATVGDAQVSEKHCGFIVNLGNASCDDVLKLVKMVQTTVKVQKNIFLEPEIKIIK